MTLTEFLAARLDEDEHDARAFGTAGPPRMLREVEAKRKLLARHQPRALDQWQVCSNCRPVDPECPGDLTSVLWPCPDLRDLAAVYSDHPDYQQEWKP